MDTTIRLEPDAQKILRGLSTFPARMRRNLADALNKRNELTVGYIQRTKLSQRGVRTLGVRTNRLRQSLRKSNATVGKRTITSSIGSNVGYFGVHEFGFDGEVTVSSHTRVISSVFGKPLKAPLRVTVNQHRRKMKMRARHMLRDGIRERQDKYIKDLSAAIHNTPLVGGN